MPDLHLEVSDTDLKDVQDAVFFRQSRFRRDGELVLPPGPGSLRGRLLAEICRGWLQMVVGRVSESELTDHELYCELNGVPCFQEDDDDDDDDDDYTDMEFPTDIDELSDDGLLD